MFDAKKEAAGATAWIKNWFENESGGAKGIIVGISGGKDSLVVAKLCCDAIGKENVFGVMMPNGVQKDIAFSKEIIQLLGIGYTTVNVEEPYQSLVTNTGIVDVTHGSASWTLACKNLAPRLRMATLYLIGQSLGYRVAGTGNASEAYVGYFTKWGDGAHDFNVLANLTVTEIIAIADALGIPEHLSRKTPTDGLSDSTDEQAFGFTYAQLDNYIRGGTTQLDPELLARIAKMRAYGFHKLVGIPQYTPVTV